MNNFHDMPDLWKRKGLIFFYICVDVVLTLLKEEHFMPICKYVFNICNSDILYFTFPN